MYYPFKIPRWALEMIILVNVAIFTAIWNDKIIALANETILALFVLYFMMLFVWRIISISLLMLNYTFKDLLTPIFALIICGIILNIIWKINPDYELAHIESLTDSEMASGINDAEWSLRVRYMDNISKLKYTDSRRIRGSSENIDNLASERIISLSAQYPNRTYDNEYILSLTKLPRHLVQKNRWPSYYYQFCPKAESLSH